MDALDIIDQMGVETENIKDVSKKIADACKKTGMQSYTKEDEERKRQKLFYKLNESDREQAVLECVVPKKYRESKFDVDRVRANLKEQYKVFKGRYKIFKFPDYISVCNGILSALRMGKLPNRSYLIGAPNGFGKSSFVFESLMTLKHYNYRTVPYISLFELATLRDETEKRMLKPFASYKAPRDDDDDWCSGDYKYLEYKQQSGYAKKPQIITNRYSFSEYINADCLFVNFTDITNKQLESRMLYQLLSIRGPKALPTIVMMSTSLDPYLNDAELREYIWDEIMTYSEKDECYDRIYHVSCYKKVVSGLEMKGSTVEPDTGIVQ